jgi:hypothetical protein
MVSLILKNKIIAPNSTDLIFATPPNILSGISICPCVSAYGEHLPTAIIFDKSFDLKPLNDHHPTEN